MSSPEGIIDLAVVLDNINALIKTLWNHQEGKVIKLDRARGHLESAGTLVARYLEDQKLLTVEQNGHHSLGFSCECGATYSNHRPTADHIVHLQTVAKQKITEPLPDLQPLSNDWVKCTWCRRNFSSTQGAKQHLRACRWKREGVRASGDSR